MHQSGDYSDFKIGEIYPGTFIRIESNVYQKPNDKVHYFVDYTCTYCNSGIIYFGRVDNIRGGRTLRCPVCGHSSNRPKGYDKDIKSKQFRTKDNMQNKKRINKNIGTVRDNWFINAFDHTTDTAHGHSYYVCIHILTGEVKVQRLPPPSKTDKTILNIADFNEKRKYVNSLNNKASFGEQVIMDWLKSNGIEFEREYSFPDLLGAGNGYLRFDFKIKNKPILIEFQGEQHFKPIEYFGGETTFKTQQLHDNLKKQYCKLHNYKLIEIPYNYTSLDDYLLELVK